MTTFDTIWLDARLATLNAGADGLGIIEQAAVAAKDGRIAFVGPAADLPGNWSASETIKLGGRWVTPGIIDIHTHYGTYLLPQTAVESNISDVLEDSDPNVADTWIENAVRPGDPAFRSGGGGGN